MQCVRRFPSRLVRWMSLCVCLALLLTSLAMAPLAGGLTALAQSRGDSPNGKGRKVQSAPPLKRAPAANLPNLDEVKVRRDPESEAPPSIPSIMRSRRKPLESRRGRKVGDPGTTGGSVGSNERETLNANDAKHSAKLAKDNSQRSSANTSAPSAVSSSVRSFQEGKFHHSNKSAALAPPLGDDQFIQNFFYWAFLRSPDSTELAYWNDILRTAYPQGQSAMLMASRELGKTLFESAEYAARNRSNHDYVYDLYKSYMMRDPDSGGWAYWENLVPQIGRENVRLGFDNGEFSDLVATLTPNGSPSGNASSLVTARVDPNNQPGNQLLARDCEWGVGLLSLPGRAGLDLGLGLSYSSLVWTRSGPSQYPYLYFDEDNGSPSPGFRLGFATVQSAQFDAQVGRKVYMLITSSGHRVELRQVGTSNVYEAGDSSYLQLTDSGGSLLVRTTDGTQMTYLWFENEWRATQIKDRNGNYLTVNYNNHADITNITDTLGRVITFNYDSYANPVSIAQTWNGQTHTWATFGWGTLNMQPGFASNVSVVGTYSGEAIPVLTQVGLDDGSYFTFQYTGAGQVNLIRRYRYDNVQSSYTAYDYAAASDNCPRISQTRVWAENWTGVNGVPSEVATQFSEPGDGSHQMVAPDGTVFKEFYGTGWQKGLTTQSEVWSGGVRQKWTTMAWTQDNTGVSYQTNPRVTETNVYDSSGNRRRTTVDYGGYAQYGLPNGVFEYAADGATLLRVTYTDYNLSQAYLDRHIIGLVSVVHVSDGTWQSKVVYSYDAAGDQLQATAAAATQHDAAYGTSFVPGRGNVTAVSRYDVTDIGNDSKALTRRIGYDTDGSVIFTRDALNHQTSLGYTDSFSDSVNRNAFAYPTTVTDADGFSSYLQYNYDFGAQTRAQGPPPAGQTQGVIQTIAYDNAARIQQVATTNTGAYQRYVYGPNYVQSFSSVNNVADDAYAIQVFDGAGRVIGAARNHPGSTGGYSMVNTIYDLMGRAVKQSNPGEINNSWVPVGDDAAGLLYTQRTYDWKGRPLFTTNTDGTQKYASYSACGCAGGEVATLTDEMGRQQKVYSDVLGRTSKTEVLNWNGTVYATTANTFNARDQVTAVKSYSGAAPSDFSCPSGTCMQSVTTYDGHGRVATQKLPQQSSPATYAYNADDTVQSVTDPRGVVATNTYSNRHLLTGVSYYVPSGIDSLAPVSFSYDGVGNRTSMSDGTGSVSYNYDQLSRLTSETRTFSFPGLSNSYTTSYGYNLSGALNSITDPSGAQVSYNYDQAGRLTSMPATGYTGITQFLSNVQYRGSGAMKHATYGNSVQVDLNYNSRMQIGQYQVSGFQSPYGTMGATMSYYEDGRTNTAYDLNDGRFDRKYEFDFSARLKEAYSGVEAHGQPAPPLNQADSPYRQSYAYDQWNNVTLRTGRIWSSQNEYDAAGYGTDNKRQGWGYDAAGNATWTGGGDGTRTYDAAGRPVTFTSSQTWQVYPNWPSGHPDAPALETQDVFDGTGQVAKHINHVRHDDSYDGGYGLIYVMSDTTTTTYYVHSTVLGGKTIMTLNSDGSFSSSSAYAGGSLIATQAHTSYTSPAVIECTNPVTGSTIVTDANASYSIRQEPDPLGRDLATAPDPTVIVDPIASSKWNEPMPIEYTWGPSAEYEQANAARAAQMDAYEVEKALFYRHRATVDWILHKNPNVGIRTSSGRSLFGTDAVKFLESDGGLLDEFDGMITDDNPFTMNSNPQNPLPGPKPAPAPTPTPGPPDPCRDRPWAAILKDWREIAGWIGWRLSPTGEPDKHLAHNSFQKVEDILAKHNFSAFPWYTPNLNFPEHGNGFHYEGQLRPDQWYHVVVHATQDYPLIIPGDYRSRPASTIEIHCERGFARPSSIGHGLDFLLH